MFDFIKISTTTFFAIIVALGVAHAEEAKKSEEKTITTQTKKSPEKKMKPKIEAKKGELIKEDIQVGDGKDTAEPGDTVVVHYTGTLLNGKKFDSSHDRNEPFSFKLGENRVIQGWEQGIKGMKAHGKRKLTIPPELAYGDRDLGVIPAHSTLVFDVEMLEVKKR